ncbi:MAG: GNAT family N-acetyltransferase [Micromonosporaceae bacterium]|nr:GNAT family N-acetyltransferase [Micromonosporaceae bacterium]
MTLDLPLLDLTVADLQLRTLLAVDAPLVVEATAQESEPALWGPRPAGPYSPEQAAATLAAWSPGQDQVSFGLLRDGRLLAALGLMADRPGSAELAYWVRSDHRRQGLATRGVRAVTGWAHRAGLVRIWLEIRPGHEASLRVAERGGFRFERRLPDHCRSWHHDDPADDTWHDCMIWSHAAQDSATGG